MKDASLNLMKAFDKSGHMDIDAMTKLIKQLRTDEVKKMMEDIGLHLCINSKSNSLINKNYFTSTIKSNNKKAMIVKICDMECY